MSRLARGWRRGGDGRPRWRAPRSVLFAILASARRGSPERPVQTDWAQIRKPQSGRIRSGPTIWARRLSRIVWVARASMLAVFAVVLAIAVGLPTGLCAGFYRGAFDPDHHADHRRVAVILPS